MAEKIEKHTVIFQDHELIVDGTTLRERKEEATFLVEGEDTPYRTNETHTRYIGENHYQVYKVLDESKNVIEHEITTSLRDDEVAVFQQEWNEKWNPAVNESIVAKAQEIQKTSTDGQDDIQDGVVPSSTMLLKEGRNPFEENKKDAGKEHGSLYDPLHIQNEKRKDAIDHVYIEKDYHSGGKYIRQLNCETGKTMCFFYENSNGSVFYQRYEPEPRMRYYHNKKTGKKTTVNERTGERKTEYLDPELEVAEEHENEGVHAFLDPEMARLEKEVTPLLEEDEEMAELEKEVAPLIEKYDNES